MVVCLIKKKRLGNTICHEFVSSFSKTRKKYGILRMYINLYFVLYENRYYQGVMLK